MQEPSSGIPGMAAASSGSIGQAGWRGDARSLATAPSASHSEQQVERVKLACEKLRKAGNGKMYFRDQFDQLLNRALSVQNAVETALVCQPPQELEPQLSRLCHSVVQLSERAEDWVEKFGNLPWIRRGLGRRGRRISSAIEMLLQQLEECAHALAEAGLSADLETTVGEVERFLRMHIDYRIPDWLAQVSEPVKETGARRMRIKHRIRRSSMMLRRRLRALLFVDGDAQDELDDGRVWWWADGLLQMYDLVHSSTSPVNAAATLPAITSMLHDKRGYVWTGHDNGAVHVWSADTTEPQMVQARAFKSAAVNAMVLDSEGRLWAGSNSGNMRVLKAVFGMSCGALPKESPSRRLPGRLSIGRHSRARAPPAADPGSPDSSSGSHGLAITAIEVVHDLMADRRGCKRHRTPGAAEPSASTAAAPPSPPTPPATSAGPRRVTTDENGGATSSSAAATAAARSKQLLAADSEEMAVQHSSSESEFATHLQEGLAMLQMQEQQTATQDEVVPGLSDTLDTAGSHPLAGVEVYQDNDGQWAFKDTLQSQAKEWMTAQKHRPHRGPVWAMLAHEGWVFSSGGRLSNTTRIIVWDAQALRLYHQVQLGYLGPSKSLAIMPWKQHPPGRKVRKASSESAVCATSWRLLSGHETGSLLMWGLCTNSGGLTPMLRIRIAADHQIASSVRGLVVMEVLNVIAVGTQAGKLILINIPAYRSSQPGLDGRLPASLDAPRTAREGDQSEAEQACRIKPQELTVMVARTAVADAHHSSLVFCTGGKATVVTSGGFGSVVVWPEEELWHLGKAARLIMPMPRRRVRSPSQRYLSTEHQGPHPLQDPPVEAVHSIVQEALREALQAKVQSLHDEAPSEPSPSGLNSPLGSRSTSLLLTGGVGKEGEQSGLAWDGDAATSSFANTLTSKIMLGLLGRRGTRGDASSSSGLLMDVTRSASDAQLRRSQSRAEAELAASNAEQMSEAASVVTADADVSGMLGTDGDHHHHHRHHLHHHHHLHSSSTTRFHVDCTPEALSASRSGSGHRIPHHNAALERNSSADSHTASDSTRSKAEASYRRTWEDLIVEKEEVMDVKLIGSGSYGDVLLCSMHGSYVAVKKLKGAAHEGFARSASQRISSLVLSQLDSQNIESGGRAEGEDRGQALLDELGKEVNIMKSIRHPNVVLFMGVMLDPPAIITEYCQRGSLYDVIRRARGNRDTGSRDSLPWHRRLSMAVDAASGMAALHAHKPQPIVHRDLKSPNLLVTDSWKVKVCDFNLSRFLNPAMSSTAVVCSKNVADNATWQSPEVIERQEYSFKGDVFAFGIILWELLTLRQPWQDMSIPQIVVAVVSKDQRPAVPPPVELPSSPLEGLDEYIELMQWCWRREPKERPSFRQVLAKLSELSMHVQGLRLAQKRQAAAASAAAASAAGAGGKASAPGRPLHSRDRSSSGQLRSRLSVAGPGSGTPPPPAALTLSETAPPLTRRTSSSLLPAAVTGTASRAGSGSAVSSSSAQAGPSGSTERRGSGGRDDGPFEGVVDGLQRRGSSASAGARTQDEGGHQPGLQRPSPDLVSSSPFFGWPEAAGQPGAPQRPSGRAASPRSPTGLGVASPFGSPSAQTTGHANIPPGSSAGGAAKQQPSSAAMASPFTQVQMNTVPSALPQPPPAALSESPPPPPPPPPSGLPGGLTGSSPFAQQQTEPQPPTAAPSEPKISSISISISSPFAQPAAPPQPQPQQQQQQQQPELPSPSSPTVAMSAVTVFSPFAQQQAPPTPALAQPQQESPEPAEAPAATPAAAPAAGPKAQEPPAPSDEAGAAEKAPGADTATQPLPFLEAHKAPEKLVPGATQLPGPVQGNRVVAVGGTSTLLVMPPAHIAVGSARKGPIIPQHRSTTGSGTALPPPPTSPKGGRDALERIVEESQSEASVSQGAFGSSFSIAPTHLDDSSHSMDSGSFSSLFGDRSSAGSLAGRAMQRPQRPPAGDGQQANQLWNEIEAAVHREGQAARDVVAGSSASSSSPAGGRAAAPAAIRSRAPVPRDERCPGPRWGVAAVPEEPAALPQEAPTPAGFSPPSMLRSPIAVVQDSAMLEGWKRKPSLDLAPDSSSSALRSRSSSLASRSDSQPQQLPP